MSIASELGLSHAESECVVAAAARHHEAGATYREAIEMALRDLLALWTEMAAGDLSRRHGLGARGCRPRRAPVPGRAGCGARKEKHPEIYCPRCLWMTGGGACPRHGGPAWTKEREEAARAKSRGEIQPTKGV